MIPQSVTPSKFSNCLPVPDHSPLPSLPQSPVNMAAAIKAINAKIRSNKVLDYVCSTRKCNPKPCHGSLLDRDRPVSGLASVVQRGIMIHGLLLWLPLVLIMASLKQFPNERTMNNLTYLTRFLGPRLQLRYPRCCRDGHPEGP